MQNRIFKIKHKEGVIVYIPSLGKIYRVSSKIAKNIPDYISTSEKSEEVADIKENRNDYVFTKTTLLLTNQCNLRCVYCYGEFNSYYRQDFIMPINLAFAAVDYIFHCALEYNRKGVYIGLLGGEPTLAWGTLVEITNYCKYKTESTRLQSKIGLSTNGFVKEDQASWLVNNMDSIVISMDGFKLIQDVQRSNSFDHTFPVARLMYRVAPKKLTFRSTISAWSVNYLPEIVRFFGENFPGCVQMYEPLFKMGRGKRSFVQSPPSQLFFQKFIQSIPIAEQFGSKLRTSVLLGIGKVEKKSDNYSFCGAAGSNFMLNHDGRVISCNRMSEKDINKAADDFCYGKFDSKDNKFVFDNEKYQRLKRLTVNEIPECKDCFAQSNCKGDCPANKATIFPKRFWGKKSYRCGEIKQFTKNILDYILNYGSNGLVL